MDELRPGHSRPHALIAGPDGRVYFVRESNQPGCGSGSAVHEPAGLVVPAIISAPQAVDSRKGLRETLGYLPQMGNVGPC